MVRRVLAPVATLVVTVLAACQGDRPAPMAPAASAMLSLADSPRLARSPAADEVVPGQYLVVFRAGVADGTGQSAAKAEEKIRKAKKAARLKHSYSAVIKGFAAELDAEDVEALRADPDVALVEPDPVVRMAGSQANATWGLDRIDQASLPLSGTYSYGNDGSGVSVYILDTGINTGHQEFGGRAVLGYDALGGNGSDCNGHGTHVAGTVGGTTYGVAKSARLVAVRVLDCSGNSAGSSLMAGMDYVVRQKQASPSTPMVANLSLVGAASSTFDQAVQNMINAGVTAVVAAGNSAVDACTVSPSRLSAAITVGASDANDTFASFSNYGSCVDVTAPGVYITSAYVGSTSALVQMSGTSMATPHVAGASALYLAANRTATPAQVHGALVNNSVTGRLLSLVGATSNRLLSVAFLGGTVTEPAPAPAPAPAPSTGSVALSPSSTSLTVGNSVTLAASGSAVSGANVYYYSSDPTVASVGAWTGVVTALKAGAVTITGVAQAAGYPSTTAAVSVTAGTSTAPAPSPTSPITLSAGAGSTTVGSTLQVTASGTAVSGANVYYYSSDPSIATVGTWTGTVTALQAGSVRITGVAQAPGYPSASVTVSATVGTSVSPAPAPAPTSPIVLSAATGSVAVGTTLQVTAAGTAVSGANVYYYSSDPTVATVGTWTGTVTALRTGSVQIVGVAQAPGYPAASVTVTATAGSGGAPAPAPTSPISLSAATGMAVGGTQQISATGTAVSGANVYYYSSDPSIATVGTWTGVVTALRPGYVKITGVAQAPGYPGAAVQISVGGS